MNENKCIILANFGGPRSLSEIEPFLAALLTDKDVVRTNMPQVIHNFLFKRIAKKRSQKVAHDYQAIGGFSPIHHDTEVLADKLRKLINYPIFTFHRYLEETHAKFIKDLESTTYDEILIFPLFPQFTYATTGSIARWFEKNLKPDTLPKIRWIKSYPTHPSFVFATQNSIREFLSKHGLVEEETALLFSAHGLPASFITTGDLYKEECTSSVNAIMEAFPEVLGKLSFQSKFGRGEWVRPYTIDVCKESSQWMGNRKNVVIVPISFTSDHIETLFEVEQEYLPPLRNAGFNAYRLPALTHRKDWILAIVEILQNTNRCNNQMLVRRK